ncbi:vomeronasal type-2 receptor 26-like [Pseudophryne corroboree]|uniref:vomeronasal type-2 receptor 26-like n=1 Tax=Pseudophryne corroboree TaxID=495146 RepID=UPI0030814550
MTILQLKNDKDIIQVINDIICFAHSVHLREYQQLQAFILAIDDINRNPEILPNVTLGYHVYDSCGNIMRVLKDVLQILSGHHVEVPNYSCMESGKLAGYIGDLQSETTNPMAQLLNLFGYTQISYGARDPLLSDRILYPNFFRTVQNYQVQHVAIAKLLRSFGWNWVGIITSDDENGERELEHLSQQLNKYGICIDFKLKVRLDFIHNIVLPVSSNSAEVVVICGTVHYSFINVLAKSLHYFYNKTLILTASWSISKELLLPSMGKLVDRSLVFTTPMHYVPALQERLYSFHPSSHPTDKLLEDIWIFHYSCFSGNPVKDFVFSIFLQRNLNNCTGNEKFEYLLNYSGDPATYQVYIAVLTMAHALHDMYMAFNVNVAKYGLSMLEFKYKVSENFKNITLSSGLPRQLLLTPNRLQGPGCSVDRSSKQLRKYVTKIKHINPHPITIFFNEYGEILETLYIVNWALVMDGNKIRPAQFYVGEFNPSHPEDQQLHILPRNIKWKNGKVPQGLCTAVCLPGTRRALRKGSHTCCYDCIPCSEGEISNVSDSENCQKCPDDEWPNEEKDICVPRILEFLSYNNDTVATVFSAISGVFFSLTIFIFGIFVSFRDTPIVKANNRNLSFILLISLKLSLLCVHLFIGRPVDITCMLRQISFGIFFAIAMSSILAKTIMVCIAFKAARPGSSWRKWLGVKLPNSVVFICSSVQVLTSAIWLSVSPPFQEHDMNTYPGIIIIQCNEGSDLAFYFMLGYMGFLAALSFGLAFMVRTLPDNFNEAKYITFSMLVFCSVWICAIPAYLSSKGKNMVTVEIFALLASGIGVLSCIFFPKCYNILLRPEMNSKRHLLEKSYL